MTEQAAVAGAPTRFRYGPGLRRAVGDLGQGLRRWELWSTLGWHDIRHRYRRSTLGPFWITLSMAGMIAGIGVLYAGLFGYPLAGYLPFLAIGLVIWGLLSEATGESSQTFIGASSAIRQIKAPFSVYLFQMLWKHLLVFAHNAVLIPILLVIFGIWPGATLLLALPGLVILYTTVAGAALTLGLASARYRDLPPIIDMVIRFAFFFTPIIWKPETLPDRAVVLLVNPFYYLIEVVRAPLLGEVPELHVWVVAVLLAVASWAVAILLFARVRHRIAFWV